MERLLICTVLLVGLAGIACSVDDSAKHLPLLIASKHQSISFSTALPEHLVQSCMRRVVYDIQ